MGIMYAMQCDICEEIQVKKEPHQIKGKTYQENGKTMFSCDACQGKLKTALSLGKGGLDDPLKAASRLLEQKDEQIKNLEMTKAAKSGDFMGVADELRRKREGGSIVPVLGLDFESQYNAARKSLPSSGQTRPTHALPAPPPQPHTKSKKRKKS